MKPDLLITWIKHCDYPIFRARLEEHRDFFGKVIIYWSEHNRFPYFDHFIQESLHHLNVVNLDPVYTDWGTEDWRNKSTNHMLDFSDSEWVCSVEQDFFVDNWKELLNRVEKESETYDLIGYKGHQGQEGRQSGYLQGDYVHPAFWFMRRTALERTSKNFSADTTRGCDHFGLISREAQKSGITTSYIQDWGFGEFIRAFHLGGVNQNYLNFENPDYTFHRPDIFFAYNYWCRLANVPQSEKFTEISLRVERTLLSLNEQEENKLVGDVDGWKRFFGVS